MRKKRKRRTRRRAAELSVRQILAWADAYHERTGSWPKRKSSGHITGAVGEKWYNVDAALRRGSRGLPGGSSLAQLLAECRGYRNPKQLPRLTVPQILRWADAYYGRCTAWPHHDTGPIAEAPGETWNGVESALNLGLRGLPGGSSLARLLAEHRGMRNPAAPPRLTVPQILAWADAHHDCTGTWPKRQSGPIPDTLGETWASVNAALIGGLRGLPQGFSLSRLLAQHRQVPNCQDRPRLTERQLLAWADAHHQRTGQWPRERSGAIQGTEGETWANVSMALREGGRGLHGGSSLAKLLAERRQVRNEKDLPRLTLAQILAWADAHQRRTGHWPARTSGAIRGTAGETWASVASALERGQRGLPAGSSLTRLLARCRGVRNRMDLPTLRIKEILRWANAHYRQTGHWPQEKSGPIADTAGETWRGVDAALRKGCRGLPGGSSLFRLLEQHRGKA